MNRPRNILLQNADPRRPVRLEFQHAMGARLQKHAFTIHQTPDETVWPGGALWDCGILLCFVVLGIAGVDTAVTLTATRLLVEEESQDNLTNHTTAGHASKKNKGSLHHHHQTNTTVTGSMTFHQTTSQISTRLCSWIHSSSSSSSSSKNHATNRQVLWKQVVEPILLTQQQQNQQFTIVELGCGVGLTGLVAAVALGASTTILTDLTDVVDKVTQENVMLNTKAAASASGSKNVKKKPPLCAKNKMEYSCRTLDHFKGIGKVLAMPLCWGNEQEGARVLEALLTMEQQTTVNTTKTKQVKKSKPKSSTTSDDNNNSQNNHTNDESAPHCGCFPNLILLGDVAYQHKPGAPSHFDILCQTLQQLMPPSHVPRTLLLFGTRLRMPASMDLLLLLQEHLTPVLVGDNGIPAQVLDPSLQHVKHNMTIHIFTNPKE